MMWRIRHLLFGTHFIALRYGGDDHVRAVLFSVGEHRPYVKAFGDFIWLDRDGFAWEALTFDKNEFKSRYPSPAVVRSAPPKRVA